MKKFEELVEITESCLEDLGNEKYSYSSELGERKYHYELFDNIYANIIVKIEKKFGFGINYYCETCDKEVSKEEYESNGRQCTNCVIEDSAIGGGW